MPGRERRPSCVSEDHIAKHPSELIARLIGDAPVAKRMIEMSKDILSALPLQWQAYFMCA